jgi:hypothetical protein
MDLPNLFSSRSKSQEDVMILFILLSETKVQALLLGLSSDGIEIRDKSTVAEYESLEDCLIKTDSSLSQLSKESENVDEVIFGLNTSWIKSGEINDDKKPILKKLTDELALKPLGFIDLSEAISSQELANNSLFSGIIALVSSTDLVLTLIHQGKVKSTQTVGKSDNFKGDFIEGLARFQEISVSENFYLPSRVILASFELLESDLRQYQQIIYDAEWKDQKQFLQPPTVEVLLEKQFIKIVATEAGKAVAMQKDLKAVVFASTPALKSKDDRESNNDDSDSSDQNIDNDQETENEDYEVDNTEEFGFEDALDKKENQNADEIDSQGGVVMDGQSDVDSFDEDLPKSFGVPIKTSFPLSTSLDSSLAVVDDDLSNELTTDKTNNKSLSRKISKLQKNPKLFIILGFILGLTVLALIGFFGARSLANTQLIITPEAISVAKDTVITLTPNQNQVTDDGAAILATTITRTVTGKSTLQTTGVTVVGERAKGKVIIYNLTEAEKTFEAGTVLRTGNLEFELNDEVKVASASTSRGSTVHGEKEVNVTARQIGAESNLEKDTSLFVVPYDSNTYNAFVHKDGLSGGTSREVRVVAQSDMDSLLSDLREELLKEVNKELESEFGEGVYALPSKKIIDSNANFSAKVGDEADNLTLDLTIELETLTYSGSDLRPLAERLLSGDIPDGYVLTQDDPQVLHSPTTSLYGATNEDTATIEVSISSFAIYDFNEDEIKQEVLGQSFEKARNNLIQREEINEVEFVVAPAILRSLVRSVPRSVERLEIEYKL